MHDVQLIVAIAENTKLVGNFVDADAEPIQGLAVLEPEGVEVVQGVVSLNMRVMDSRRSVFGFAYHTRSTPTCIVLMESLAILVAAMEMVLPCFSGGTPFVMADSMSLVLDPCLRHDTHDRLHMSW